MGRAAVSGGRSWGVHGSSAQRAPSPSPTPTHSRPSPRARAGVQPPQAAHAQSMFVTPPTMTGCDGFFDVAWANVKVPRYAESLVAIAGAAIASNLQA